ncbi:putative glucose-methanol-choline oxidoreductase [Apodospora peruviana]|uniref:Glucose-methanol-choline oxidoreductase n=1 Tax=Apodospora peruviana TaxID=516989 RepID=A0AAE0MBE4_9PEZI|nr:putative glucose-methanol-choline oxidoreductase [Apodospora peruviana]
MNPDTYDFIVVGAGPSGCSVASRLANTRSRPSVLLLESGGTNADPKFRLARERFMLWATHGLAIDYGYKTTPQAALNGRELAYHRGKGLGGSSATNLGVWDYGSKPEYDEWARLVGDDEWRWENVVARMKKIENFHDYTPTEMKKYAQPNPGTHGTEGPVDATLSAEWDPTLPLILDAVKAYGLPLNPDISGDQCIGFGVPAGTVNGGLRVTAASAYLTDKQSNLDVVTDSPVTRVLFDGLRAVGVEISGAKKYYSSKETIICAGSIDTPKLFLLSGVGPAEELSNLGISAVLDQPAIGTNLRDHPMIRLAASVKDGVILPSQPLATDTDIVSTCSGYCKLNTTGYAELATADAATQKHLSNPLAPAYELVTRITPKPSRDGFLWNASVVMMNSMSTGRIFLQSSDPNTPPAIDLNLLSHPYDVHATMDAVRSTAQLLQNSTIPTAGLAVGPKSLEDKDVLEFIKSNLGHLWHAAGTMKMGLASERDTCVAPDFRVLGLDGVRVADMSVAPIIPSNHTQSTAYLIGETAASKIIAEYKLDE